MRSSAVLRKARLTVSCKGDILAEKSLSYVKPAEMIAFTLPAEKTGNLPPGSTISFSLIPVNEEEKENENGKRK